MNHFQHYSREAMNNKHFCRDICWLIETLKQREISKSEKEFVQIKVTDILIPQIFSLFLAIYSKKSNCKKYHGINILTFFENFLEF
jgi:hypothetical protein